MLVHDFLDHIVINDELIHVHHLILFHFEISKEEYKNIDHTKRMHEYINTVSCKERHSSSIEIYFR
jgi:hypothetical protein